MSSVVLPVCGLIDIVIFYSILFAQYFLAKHKVIQLGKQRWTLLLNLLHDFTK